MLMQGDMNKVLTEVNVILEGAFKRIEALEDRLMRIESTAPVKRGPGRPKKVNSENKAA